VYTSLLTFHSAVELVAFGRSELRFVVAIQQRIQCICVPKAQTYPIEHRDGGYSGKVRPGMILMFCGAMSEDDLGE
jgi:hypothetical protein